MNNYNKMFFHHIKHLNNHMQGFAGQVKILDIIFEHGTISQKELLEIADIKASSLSEALSKLEKRKLIKRDDDPNDSRGNIISLTKYGKNMAERSKKMRSWHENKMFKHLSDEEKEQLNAILEKMHASIDDDEFSHFHFRGAHWGFGDNNKKANKKDR